MEQKTDLQSGEFKSFSRDEIKSLVKENPAVGNNLLDSVLSAYANYALELNGTSPDEMLSMKNIVWSARVTLKKIVDGSQLDNDEIERRDAVLQGLIVELIPGIDRFEYKIDGNNVKVRSPYDPDGDDDVNFVQRLTKKDRENKDYESDQAGELVEVVGRNKLARLWMVFNPGNLNVLINELSNQDFDIIIGLVEKGEDKLPKQFISDDEIKRVKSWFDWNKEGKQGEKPMIPAFGLFVTEYKKSRNFKESLGVVMATYTHDFLQNTHMVPLADTEDDPGAAATW